MKSRWYKPTGARVAHYMRVRVWWKPLRLESLCGKWAVWWPKDLDYRNLHAKATCKACAAKCGKQWLKAKEARHEDI